MKASDLFPSKWLKSTDLPAGQAVKVCIQRVEYEEVGGDMKGVVYFQDRTKGLVLNKTKTGTLQDQFGDEMDNWVGSTIELRADKTNFQGKVVDCIMVQIPVPRTDNTPENEATPEAPF